MTPVYQATLASNQVKGKENTFERSNKSVTYKEAILTKLVQHKIIPFQDKDDDIL